MSCMKMRSMILMMVVSALVFIPACSQAQLKKAQSVTSQVSTATSQAALPASASPQEKVIHEAVQAIVPIFPYGNQALAVLAAIAGAAGIVIQTFRRNSAISTHQAAITEMSRNLTPEVKAALSARTQSILHKSLS